MSRLGFLVSAIGLLALGAFPSAPAFHAGAIEDPQEILYVRELPEGLSAILSRTYVAEGGFADVLLWVPDGGTNHTVTVENVRFQSVSRGLHQAGDAQARVSEEGGIWWKIRAADFNVSINPGERLTLSLSTFFSEDATFEFRVSGPATAFRAFVEVPPGSVPVLHGLDSKPLVYKLQEGTTIYASVAEPHEVLDPEEVVTVGSQADASSFFQRFWPILIAIILVPIGFVGGYLFARRR